MSRNHIISAWLFMMGICGGAYASDEPYSVSEMLSSSPPQKGMVYAGSAGAFHKTAGTANEIAQVTLTYYTSAACTTGGSSTFVTSASSPPMTIPSSGTVYLNSESAYEVATTNLGLSPGTLQSVLVVFSSPAAAFSAGGSGVCLPITCSGSTCTTTSSTESYTLNLVPTSTQLFTSQNPALSPTTPTFTAQVSSSIGIPSGTVTFFMSHTAICSNVTLSNGKATCSSSSFGPQPTAMTFTATYNANAIYATSTSAAINQYYNSSAFPLTASNAPAYLTAVPGNGSVTLAWIPPAFTGGQTISSYTITPYVAGVAQTPITGITAISHTVTGLTNNTSYTFTVAAVNASGTGTLVAYSSPVTPLNRVVLNTSNNILNLNVSGVARNILFINPTSSIVRITTTPVTANISNLPTGSTISYTSCNKGAMLAANGGSCVITISPGATVSKNGSNLCTTGISPTSSTFTIANTGTSLTGSFVVLGHACQSQNGYLYSIDDNAPPTASMGGKVATTSDQVAPGTGLHWGAFGSIYAITETSNPISPNPSTGQVAGQGSCTGPFDGLCNANNIYLYYQNFATGHPISLTTYAAGQCKQTISTHSDWFLPSMCDLNYSANIGPGLRCPDSYGTENIQSSLGALNLLSGTYWSSTEYSGAPATSAWTQFYPTPSQATQTQTTISSLEGVRCVRGLTL